VIFDVAKLLTTHKFESFFGKQLTLQRQGYNTFIQQGKLNLNLNQTINTFPITVQKEISELWGHSPNRCIHFHILEPTNGLHFNRKISFEVLTV